MWFAENTASLPWSVGNREVGLMLIPLLFEENMIAKQHSKRYCELTCRKLHVEHGADPASRLSITAIYSRQTLTSHIPPQADTRVISLLDRQIFVQPRKYFSSSSRGSYLWHNSAFLCCSVAYFNSVQVSVPTSKLRPNFARWSVIYWGPLHGTGFLSHPGY